jgi:internalin A
LAVIEKMKYPEETLLIGDQVRELHYLIIFSKNRELRNIKPLRGLVNLEHLDLDDSQVTDLSPLKELHNLKYLSFNNTPVADISDLRGLVNLTHLELKKTQVTNISHLDQLLKLEDLQISGTKVSNLQPLSKLISLESLIASDAPITHLTPLIVHAKHHNLRWVSVADNKSLRDHALQVKKQVPLLQIAHIAPRKLPSLCCVRTTQDCPELQP